MDLRKLIANQMDLKEIFEEEWRRIWFMGENRLELI